MAKFKLMLVAFAVAMFAASRVSLAARGPDCTGGEPGGGPQNAISGTYTMSFIGSLAGFEGDYPIAGSGSVTVDGKGNVTGGVIRCNFHDLEWTSPITGGCYTINTDLTGFMTIRTSENVCERDPGGVDLQLAVSYAGNQFQFSSDASGANSSTGGDFPLSGTANKLVPIIPVP
jgi:hypothetical protein